MYLDNKYTKWYFNLIKNAKSRNFLSRKQAVEFLGYVEKHHIVPKSLGGSNDKENLVFLTAKEHFICHLLLIKMTCDVNKEKMITAAWRMISSISESQNRYIACARAYEKLKRLMSESRKGKTTWNKGVPPSHSTRILLRNKMLEYNHSLGRITDEELILAKLLPLGEKLPKKNKKHRQPRKKGYKFTKSVPSKRICCLYCRKDIPIANFAYSHGDKCKLKNTL